MIDNETMNPTANNSIVNDLLSCQTYWFNLTASTSVGPGKASSDSVTPGDSGMVYQKQENVKPISLVHYEVIS